MRSPSFFRRLALVLVTAAGMVACTGKDGDAPGGGASPGKTIGVSLLTMTNPFFKEMADAMEAEGKKRGFEVLVTAGELDPARQRGQVQDFLVRKVSAIVLSPCDSKAVGTSIAEANAAGIPVFTADIAARSGKVVTHVASDNVQGGRLAAQAMAERLGGTGEVLIIDHPTVASVQDRVRGFEEEMRKHPGIRIVGRPSSDGQRARAMAVMEDMLQAHPTLKGVFGINDDSALGATAVLDAAGRTDIVVIGYDATEEAQAAIRSGGPLKADVVQYPRRIGRTAIEMIARHLAGDEVPAVVPIDVGLWTK